MTFLPLYPRVSCKFDGKAIFDESRTVHVTFRAGKLQKFVPNAHFNQSVACQLEAAFYRIALDKERNIDAVKHPQRDAIKDEQDPDNSPSSHADRM